MPHYVLHNKVPLAAKWERLRPGEVETPLIVSQPAGTRGELHYRGRPKGRPIEVDAILDGYEAQANLVDQLTAIQKRQGAHGTLVVQGPTGDTFKRCTFVRVRITQPPRPDGSGQHGWYCRVTLIFRQATLWT